MTRIICPHCDTGLEDERSFDAHMESEHPVRHASVGFGHTLGP